jgi:hypothetical protein
MKWRAAAANGFEACLLQITIENNKDSRGLNYKTFYSRNYYCSVVS